MQGSATQIFRQEPGTAKTALRIQHQGDTQSSGSGVVFDDVRADSGRASRGVSRTNSGRAC